MSDLIERLQKARCYKDENSFGARSTRWLHLVPCDIDYAIREIERLRDENERLKEKVQEQTTDKCADGEAG